MRLQTYSELMYEDLDASITQRYPIDDVWCSQRSMPTSREFSFRRSGGKLMLVIRKTAASGRSPKVTRFACRDPRVGCILFKMHRASMRDGAGEVTARENDIGLPNTMDRVTKKKMTVAIAITKATRRCRHTPMSSLYEAHRRYVTGSIAYLRCCMETALPCVKEAWLAHPYGSHGATVRNESLSELRRHILRRQHDG